MHNRYISGPAAVLLLTFSFATGSAFAGPMDKGASASAITRDDLQRCMNRNDGMVNFIATRALIPRDSMDTPRLYQSSSDTLSDAVVSADGGAHPIVIESNGVYMEFRADGQHRSAKTQLLALCSANPALDLPDEFRAQVTAQLYPAKSLIDIEQEEAWKRRLLRQKLRDGGASGIPSLIDEPKGP
ncbi:MAG: hypothetical protein EBQ96_02160 [Proteobacteria bacterium]|nr:hypothetical protein [Pseudomonadota bacterium]